MSQELRLNIPLVSVQCSNWVKLVWFVSVDMKLSLFEMLKLGICVEALACKQNCTNKQLNRWTNAQLLLLIHYNRFMPLCPGLPGWVSTRRINHSGFCWSRDDGVALASAKPYASNCTSLQKITMSAPYHSNFYGPDAHPDTQPTASKHWSHKMNKCTKHNKNEKTWHAYITMSWYRVQLDTFNILPEYPLCTSVAS